MSDKHYVHSPDETELAKVLRQSKGWFEVYGTTLIYAVAAVLAAAAVIVYMQRTPPASAPASAALMSALKVGSLFNSGQPIPEDFQDIADQFPNSDIGARARLRQADLLLEKAVLNMFSDRAAAVSELEAAEKAYQRLVDRSNIPADVRERVLAGLARLAETQCDGSTAKTDAAIAAWQRVLDEFPKSAVFKEIAEKRVKQLQLESTRDFYAWFQQQNPKPADDALMPQDRPPGVPDIPNPFQLPEISIPDLSTPAATPPTDSTNLLVPPSPKPEPAEPKSESPSSDPSAPTSPAPTSPAPTSPAPTSPAPTSPAPTSPAPSEPAPSEPAPSEPAPSEPAPSEPAPSEPAPSEPEPGKPAE